jgi:uncharacterized membrane protein YbhN (UPF0104 family)
MNRTNVKNTGIGLLVGGAFLFFAMKQIHVSEIIQHIQVVSVPQMMIIIVGCLLGTVIRGWRWWYTLPKPHHLSEFWPTQRALGICYAANNFIPRSGEVLRVITLRKSTGRSAASLSSTVILDRFFLDLLGLIGIMATALFINSELILNIYEHAFQIFYTLCLLAVLALAGLMLLAFYPVFFITCLHLVKLHRFPSLYEKIEHLTHELSKGMSSVRAPLPFLLILVQTVAIWAVYFLTFYAALHFFHISSTIPHALLAFSISMLGIVFPSPGGVGTYHFFTKLALMNVFFLTASEALGFAFFMHTAIFMTNTLYGLICLALPDGRSYTGKTIKNEMNKT